MTNEFIFETLMDHIISETTPSEVISVAGFRKFSLLARFEGPPSASVSFTIQHNRLVISQETVELSAGGWLTFSKVYPVFAPEIGVVIYNPPPGLMVRMTIYAGY